MEGGANGMLSEEYVSILDVLFQQVGMRFKCLKMNNSSICAGFLLRYIFFYVIFADQRILP